MNKVIWYCNHYSPVSEQVSYARGPVLMEGLLDFGFKPYIITATYDHINGNKVLQNEKVKFIRGVGYYLIKTPSYLGNGFSRLRNMFAYARGINRQVKDIIAFTGKPDIIIVSSAHMFHYGALEKIAKKYQAKLVFEVRDLWPLSLIQILHMHPYHPLVFLMRQTEKRAYRNSDLIVSLLPNAYEYFKKFGIKKEKVKWISNGAALLALPKINVGEMPLFETLKCIRPKARLIIGYTGAHGSPNALEQLVDAMNIVYQKGHVDIYAVFVGDGNCKADLVKRAVQCPTILFFDRIEKSLISLFLASIDIVFVGARNLELYRYGVSPNKLYEAMLNEKPVLKTFVSDGIVPYEDFCFSALAEQPEALANVIIDIAHNKKVELKRMGEAGAAIAKKQFDWKQLAKDYKEALETL